MKTIDVKTVFLGIIYPIISVNNLENNIYMLTVNMEMGDMNNVVIVSKILLLI